MGAKTPKSGKIRLKFGKWDLESGRTHPKLGIFTPLMRDLVKLVGVALGER